MPRRLPLVTVVFLTATAALSVYWVYQVDRGLCNGCQNCVPWCPEGAISMQGPDAYIDPEICTACAECLYHCPRGAIFRVWYTGTGEEEPPPVLTVLAPNPSSGTVTVTGIDPGSVLSVFDSSGRLVISCEAGGHEAVVTLPGTGSGLHVLLVDGSPALSFTVIR